MAEPLRAPRPFGTTLTLLGTAGGPPTVRGRLGIASALTVDDTTYLVDMGPGSHHQIGAAGLLHSRLGGVFITHLHSDHVSDLFNLFWLRFGGMQGLKGPVPVLGPGSAGQLPQGDDADVVAPEDPAPGLAAFVSHAFRAAAYDINVRMHDEAWPDPRDLVRVSEIDVEQWGADAASTPVPTMDPAVVFEDERVRVSAVLVPHPPVFPAFAFRFDTAHGSVVFSGDTAPSHNLVALARGADVLVHEVISMRWLAEQQFSTRLTAHLADSHTDVSRVGEIAQKAGVPTLVLSHLVPGGVDQVSDEEWHREASRGFDGRVVVGHDLDRLELPNA